MAKIDPDEICPCGSGALFKDCHRPRVRTNRMPEIRETIVLRVIPEPDPNTKTVVEYNGPGTTLIQGYETHIALVCGKCQAILAAGIEKSQIQDAVLRCKACGSFNDT